MTPIVQGAASHPVVVLGGGPAGCAVALALAARGVTHVQVVEAGAYEALRVGESIPPDTRRLLHRLGVWDAFRAAGHGVCYGSRAAWGSHTAGANDFLLNPLGTGWHLDRRAFDAMLADAVAARGIALHRRTRYRHAAPRADGGFDVTLEDGAGQRTVRAAYVVDATGYRAAFAKAQGAEAERHDRLVCVYGFFALPPGAGPARTTLLEAEPHGWWYAARLPGARVAVAFATDPETLRAEGLRTPEAWLWRLSGTHLVAPALADAAFLPDSLLVRPALSQQRPAAGPGWLAVGDAASVYDPICARGLHKALSDGLAAGEALADHLAGEEEAPTAYADGVRARFAAYVRQRAYLYELEQRWPDAPFWAQRHAADREVPRASSAPVA